MPVHRRFLVIEDDPARGTAFCALIRPGHEAVGVENGGPRSPPHASSAHRDRPRHADAGDGRLAVSPAPAPIPPQGHPVLVVSRESIPKQVLSSGLAASSGNRSIR
jgi:hypothetical protein